MLWIQQSLRMHGPYQVVRQHYSSVLVTQHGFMVEDLLLILHEMSFISKSKQATTR